MIWFLFISIFLVLLIVIYTSIPWAERKILFFPTNKTGWYPTRRFDNVYIDVNDPTHLIREKDRCGHKYKYINAWHFNNYPGHKTVMFCHGNTGNISNRRYIANICKKFKLNLLIYDYRGYGKSSGTPAKKNLRKDGEVVYKYLTKRCKISPKNIIIWGESLGGVAAISTASKYKCHSLILLNTFSGLDDITMYHFTGGIHRAISKGVATLANLRFDMIPTRRYMKKVKCPVAIMHSKEDEVIPYHCAEILYNSVNHDKKLLIEIGGGHSSPDISVHEMTELFSFCKIDIPKSCTESDLRKILEDIRTVAERYHYFM